jgi:coniferyl-aldehyde dehydrogenase
MSQLLTDISQPDFTTSDKTVHLRALLETQRAAARQDRLPDRATRLERLARLRRLVRWHDTEIEAAISEDFGVRSPMETRLAELALIVAEIRHARQKLRSWMRPERRRLGLSGGPGRGWIRYEPVGVVGIISPWNYPVSMALVPLVNALAAGNRAMLKPSELTPATSALLHRLIADAFDDSEVAVVTGGPEIGKAFAALPFDHLLFTGSTSVGRKVAAAAAPNLTPVTLELGGKSPVIVAPDYDLDAAARSIAHGKFLNAGQSCVAPDYVLTPKGTGRELADRILDAARTAYPECGSNPDYSAIISDDHHDRLSDAVEAARAAGAEVLTVADASASGHRKLPPTVVLGAPDDTPLMQEEIFGPILPILEYDDLDAALQRIADGDRPLALYCFTRDAATRRTVLDGAISGGVTLNGTMLHVAQENLPFGGIGPSGTGAYHGHDGFRRFSHARAVYEARWFNPAEKLGPPWGGVARRMSRFLLNR